MAAADNIPVLVIGGPTGVGKTRISVEVARRVNAEIVSADSAQVYRGLDIGTAKIRPDEMAGVPHHLIDVVDPQCPYSVAQFQQMAGATIDDIRRRGRLPMIVGGTGLWIRALIRAFPFPPETVGPPVRKRIEAAAERFGWDAVSRALRVVDPDSFRRIAPNDTRRLMRALEIWWSTGRRLARTGGDSPYQARIWILTRPLADLHRRLHHRVDTMMELGLLDEVLGLLCRGVSPRAQSLSAIGYREVVEWYRGKMCVEAIAPLIKRHSEQYAKRQLTWFRAEKSARWLDLSAWTEHEAVEMIVRDEASSSSV